MKTVTIYHAKTQLSKLVKEVNNGREITIARGKEIVAKLVPAGIKNKNRRMGDLRGKIKTDDDFDKEMADFEDYMK